MKAKLVLLGMFMLFFPEVLGYSYVISNLNPANNSYAPFSGQNCQPVTVSFSIALEVNPLNPLDWGAWMFGKDIYPMLWYTRMVPSPLQNYVTYGSLQHITTSSELRPNFIIPNVCYNEVWAWNGAVSEDGINVYDDAISDTYYIKGIITNVSYGPPSASNLKSCLNGDGTNCYGSGASFSYLTSIVYPVFNLSSNAQRVTVTLYASSDVRGVLPTSKRTTDMGGSSKIYIASGVPVQPGETITWYAELDDGVHTVVKTSSVVFSINPSPNSPPAVNITYPANNQHFSYGHTVTTINATVTDSDTPQSSLTVQFIVNNKLECTRQQSSQYYSCDVSTVKAGNYKVIVSAVDTVADNRRNKTIYFVVDPPVSVNNPPVCNLLPYTDRVGKNGSLQFTLNASDSDGDPLWFDIYCQYLSANDTSKEAQNDSPYASTGWAGPFSVEKGESYQYTYTCPDKSKNPAQWSVPGKYIVRACVTDGSSSDGKSGFGLENYNICDNAEIQVMNVNEVVTFDKDSSIQFSPCLISSDECSPGILNEFYDGMVGFVRGWMIYFIYCFIVVAMGLVAYYVYRRIKEGIL